MVVVIRKSCLTGRVVWVYKGKSKASSYVMYLLACRRELAREKNKASVDEQRRKNIMNVLNECVADLCFAGPLTPEQEAAAKELKRLAEEPVATCNEFRDHILEERRRREEDKEIRRQMKERDKAKKDYV